jgi:hypothetical protein
MAKSAEASMLWPIKDSAPFCAFIYEQIQWSSAQADEISNASLPPSEKMKEGKIACFLNISHNGDEGVLHEEKLHANFCFLFTYI